MGLVGMIPSLDNGGSSGMGTDARSSRVGGVRSGLNNTDIVKGEEGMGDEPGSESARRRKIGV
jgi:hypothetical protein